MRLGNVLDGCVLCVYVGGDGECLGLRLCLHYGCFRMQMKLNVVMEYHARRKKTHKDNVIEGEQSDESV